MSRSHMEEFVATNVESKTVFSVEERECVGHDVPRSLSEVNIPLHENFKNEQRSDDEACQHSEKPCHEREFCEERDPTPSDNDFDFQSEYDYQLLLRDEEEEMMQQEWQETYHMEELNRELAILDELQQIHDEEYPDNHDMQAGQQEIGETSDNFVEIDEGEDIFDLEGTPLSNDMQIQDLVAICDVRDREDRSSTSDCGENLGNQSTAKADLGKAACVVCLEAPRTHAYVPCGHFCVCFSCAKEQTKVQCSMTAASTCPVCKQASTRVMRIFIP